MGLCYGLKASLQDIFGKFGNFVESIFTTSKVDFYGEAELSLGSVTCTGTVTVNSNGEVSFDISTPSDMLLGEIKKMAKLPVTIDTNGISADIPIAGPLYAVTGMTFDDDGNCKLKLGAKLGANTPVGGASVGAGVLLQFKPSVQKGTFGTIENQKNNELNENIRKAEYYNSVDFFMDNME